MIGGLETYTISQFIPVTPEVYFRLFERLNAAVWPWQIPVFAAVGTAATLAWCRRGLLGGVLLGVCWIWVAAVFHFRLHAELNWAGPYFGWAFLAQGGLVLLAGFRGRLARVPGPRATAGAALIGAGAVLYPLLGPLTGRSWAGLDVAGTAPDPTALLTLGVLLFPARVPWLLVPVPLLWSLYSGATWWGLGWWPGVINAAAVTLFVAVAPLAGVRSGRGGELAG